MDNGWTTKQIKAYSELKRHRRILTKPQIKTLAGQIKAGDPDAAMRGLCYLLQKQRGGANHGKI